MFFEPKKGEAFYNIVFFFKHQLYFVPANHEKENVLYLRWFMFRFFTVFNFVGISVHLVVSIRYKYYAGIFEDLALLSGVFSMYMGFVLARKNYEKWSQFLRELINFDTYGKPEGYETVVRRFNIWSTWVLLYGISGAILFIPSPLNNERPCPKKSDLHGMIENCGLVHPFWWPSQLTPLQKLILNVFQTISLLHSSVPATQMILLIIAMAEVLRIRMNHFYQRLKEVFDDDVNDDEVRERLYSCVRYHQYLLNLATDFNTTFFSNFSLLTAVSSVTAALLLTQIMKVNNMATIGYTFAWVTGIFAICWTGQVMEDMFHEVSEVAYLSKWYETNVSNRKIILILMMRASKRLKFEMIIPGGQNFQMFVKLAKATYSYLTVMTQYQQK